MRIGVIGINHKLASVALREKIARICQRRLAPKALHPIIDYVPLSTCNRTEIYFHAPDLSLAHIYLLGVLREGIDEEFEHRVYSYFGSDCFHHLAKVTSGLDSAIIGETEIQGQVKEAYLSCNQKLPSELHFLFQKCLKIGKEVRTQFTIRRGMPTLEETIYHMAKYFLGDLEKKRILFVGFSKINQKIYHWFSQKSSLELTYCNRTESKLCSYRSLSWANLDQWHTYDLVIFGTKSPHYLISTPLTKSVGPRLLIDLSVPRNVDPQVAHTPDVKLMNIDQLTRVMERNRSLKLTEIERIEHTVIKKTIQRQIDIFNLKRRQHIA